VDVLSIMGLLLASIAIILGAILKGAGVHALVSAAAFMIVVVGTVAAICRGCSVRHLTSRIWSLQKWSSGATSRAARGCWGSSA